MGDIIIAGIYWLHLIGTVVWLGGLAFILLIAIPSTKKVLGVEAGNVMGEISKRFTPIANYCILILLVTGTVLTAVNSEFSGIGKWANNWSLSLIVKHVLVLGMVTVHFYRGLVLAPKIARTEPTPQKASLQKLSLNLVKMNFCFGMVVLLISGFIAILK